MKGHLWRGNAFKQNATGFLVALVEVHTDFCIGKIFMLQFKFSSYFPFSLDKKQSKKKSLASLYNFFFKITTFEICVCIAGVLVLKTLHLALQCSEGG